MLSIQEKISLTFIPGNLENYHQACGVRLRAEYGNIPQDFDDHTNTARLYRNAIYVEILYIGVAMWYAKNQNESIRTAAKVVGICALVILGPTGFLLNKSIHLLDGCMHIIDQRIEDRQRNQRYEEQRDIQWFCFCVETDESFRSAARALGVPEEFLRPNITAQEAEALGLIRALAERDLNLNKITEHLTCKDFIDMVLKDETAINTARVLGVEDQFLNPALTIDEAKRLGLPAHLTGLQIYVSDILQFDLETVYRFRDEVLPNPQRMATTRALLNFRFTRTEFTDERDQLLYAYSLVKDLKRKNITIDRIIEQTGAI